MGWLWSTSPGEKPKEADQTKSQNAPDPAPSPTKRNITLTEEQRMRIFGKAGLDFVTPESREAKADAELDEFLKSFEAPTAAVGGIAPPIGPPKHYDESGRRVLEDGTPDISPDALYPRHMNCRQAFDQAFYCQSLGGKFNDIYRHGHLQSCSEHWNAFWFCMRIRTLPGKDKEHQISEYYKERDEKKRAEFGSSEDVWDLRTKAVERAFWRNPDEEGAGDIAVKE